MCSRQSIVKRLRLRDSGSERILQILIMHMSIHSPVGNSKNLEPVSEIIEEDGFMQCGIFLPSHESQLTIESNTFLDSQSEHQSMIIFLKFMPKVGFCLFNFMCVFCLHVSALHCVVPSKDRKEHEIPWNRNYRQL